jgi:hypothetical protein
MHGGVVAFAASRVRCETRIDASQRKRAARREDFRKPNWWSFVERRAGAKKETLVTEMILTFFIVVAGNVSFSHAH